MDFGEALKMLKDGKMMAREGWNGKHQFVRMQFPDAHSANTLPYIFIVTEQVERVPWTASQTDLLSDDWEPVIDGPGPDPV